MTKPRFLMWCKWIHVEMGLLVPRALCLTTWKNARKDATKTALHESKVAHLLMVRTLILQADIWTGRPCFLKCDWKKRLSSKRLLFYMIHGFYCAWKTKDDTENCHKCTIVLSTALQVYVFILTKETWSDRSLLYLWGCVVTLVNLPVALTIQRKEVQFPETTRTHFFTHSLITQHWWNDQSWETLPGQVSFIWGPWIWVTGSDLLVFSLKNFHWL